MSYCNMRAVESSSLDFYYRQSPRKHFSLSNIDGFQKQTCSHSDTSTNLTRRSIINTIKRFENELKNDQNQEIKTIKKNPIDNLIFHKMNRHEAVMNEDLIDTDSEATTFTVISCYEKARNSEKRGDKTTNSWTPIKQLSNETKLKTVKQENDTSLTRISEVHESIQTSHSTASYEQKLPQEHFKTKPKLGKKFKLLRQNYSTGNEIQCSKRSRFSNSNLDDQKRHVSYNKKQNNKTPNKIFESTQANNKQSVILPACNIL